MISVSEAMETLIEGNARTFLARFLINGSELSCDILSITVTKGAGEKFSPGFLFIPYMEARISNCNVDLEGVDITLQIGRTTTDWMTMGKFTVAETKTAQGETTFTAVGFLNSKCGDDVTISAGTTVTDAISTITGITGLSVNYCGVTATGTITTGYTKPAREWLGMIAGVLGGSVTEDNNGGIMIFKPMAGDEIDESEDRCVDPPEIAENDITENGYTFRPGKMSLTLGDPRIEPWDYLSAEISGDHYTMPCQRITHTFDGGIQTMIDCTRTLPQADIIKGPMEVKLDGVEAVATDALEQAESTNNYFWFTSTDTGAGQGAHITEKPQNEFLLDPSQGGGNLLADADGIKVRDGLTELASFGATEARVGATNSAHATFGEMGMEVTDKNGAETLRVSNSAVTRRVMISREYAPILESETITLSPPSSTNYFYVELYINGFLRASANIAIGETKNVYGTSFVVTRTSSSQISYTGPRGGYRDGMMRCYYEADIESPIFVFGSESEANGPNSSAMGCGVIAETLDYSPFYDGEGGVAIGKYNVPTWTEGDYNKEVPYLFTVGNGTDDSNRSNAFALKESGEAIFGAGGSFNGSLSAGNGHFAYGVDIDDGESYCIDGVPLSASDVSAIPTSDKQSYSSASSLSWNSLSAGQKAMVPTIQGLAYWNGAYDGSSSNLKYSSKGVMIGTTSLSSSGTNHTGISIGANATKASSFTVTRAGYYPVCIDRINLGGTGSDKIAINKWGITARSNGSVTYEIAYYNPTSTAYTSVTIAVYVLWASL